MPNPCRVLLRAAFGCIAGLALCGHALAEEAWPSKPIRIIVPYTAGGGVDTVARLLGDKLGKSLGQPVIVDNKPGASGMIGAQAAAKSPPDGYTLLLSAAGEIAVNPHLYKAKMKYDAQKELAPISVIVRVPNVLVVNTDVPARNTAELVAYAKKNPGTLTYSSSGVGNPQPLNGELFNILRKLHAALTDALRDPKFAKKLEILGAEPALMSPQDFAKFIATESTKFAKIVADANVTLEN
jgi:tripartite-type tricarboxylate transporter receptor subunit TctC